MPTPGIADTFVWTNVTVPPTAPLNLRRHHTMRLAKERTAVCQLLLLGCILPHSRVLAEDQPAATQEPQRQLTIHLADADTGAPLSGIVRITRQDRNQHVRPPELIPRKNGWQTTQAVSEITVPAAKLRIEALRGLQTELSFVDVDTTKDEPHNASLKLRRFYDAKQRGWRNANTHLHLMDRSRIDAERYLHEVPEADGLELVYLSHLRRIPDETKYISNEIVEQHLSETLLSRISHQNVILRPGEEHRHNFGRGGEGFGHVMLLDIAKLIRPVSIGPGIMRSGTDGIPLKPGIDEARRDGATIVWCHNNYGFEDIPNWVGGRLDAQNIFDGGSRGSYEESFYRYLNLGMRIPFSTGTDWFIEDFSRVYVPLTERLTSEAWLKQLARGRSFITNGPLLEFTVDDHSIGDTLQLSQSRELKVTARAIGRSDFRSLEIVRNGEVIDSVAAKMVNGHFEATWESRILVDEPSWLAVRTPVAGPKNEFDRPINAHTSPVYIDLEGERPFQPEVALDLIREIEESLQKIRVQAVFANDSELERVMQVYRDGIQTLKKRITERDD